MRRMLAAVSWPIVRAMVPVKQLAWRTRWGLLRGALLELTGLVDFLLVPLLVQNGAIRLTWEAFGRGNFLFGRAVMVVSHAEAEAVRTDTLRGSHFMGLPIVGFESTAFMTNAGPINASQPARRVLRAHLDGAVLSDWHRKPDLDTVRVKAGPALAAWVAGPDWHDMFAIRAAITRALGLLLAEVDLGAEPAASVTKAYLRRFGELSAFGRYAPGLLGLLGTREAMRRDVYLPLKRLGMDALVVDMVLFAGMFSVGTVVMHAVERCRAEDIDYGTLSPAGRIAFVTECLRLHPTVTSIHRVVEAPETVRIRGRDLEVQPGQEIAYPFACVNRDPAAFAEPERFRLDRPPEEIARILSWSRGPHACPVRDLSVLVTVAALDALGAGRGDLRQLRLFNVEV